MEGGMEYGIIYGEILNWTEFTYGVVNPFCDYLARYQ